MREKAVFFHTHGVVHWLAWLHNTTVCLDLSLIQHVQ